MQVLHKRGNEVFFYDFFAVFKAAYLKKLQTSTSAIRASPWKLVEQKKGQKTCTTKKKCIQGVPLRVQANNETRKQARSWKHGMWNETLKLCNPLKDEQKLFIIGLILFHLKTSSIKVNTVYGSECREFEVVFFP